MKKEGVLIYLVLLISLIFVSTNVLAVDANTCGVVPRAQCDDSTTEGYVVMGLSGNGNNSHGQTKDEFDANPYPYVLCCNIGSGNTQCDDNKILGLSSSTNAHAEGREWINYNVHVCYEDFKVISSAEDNCPTFSGEGPSIELLSLSGPTNAHIGSPGYYSSAESRKLCFTSAIAGLIPQGYWANQSDINDNIEILNTSEQTKVKMVLRGYNLTVSATVKFEIWENDPLEDDPIRTGDDAITGTVDSDRNVNVEWTPNDNDLVKTESGDWKQFYFIAKYSDGTGIFEGNDGIGTYLEIIVDDTQIIECMQVFLCGDYSGLENGQNKCSTDVCGVASDSVPSEIDCDDPNTDCNCLWNNNINPNVCEASFDADAESIPPGKIICNVGDGGECDLCESDTKICRNGVPICTKDVDCVVNGNDVITVTSTQVGSCRIHDETSSNSCDDQGTISYSWQASWTWDISNEYSTLSSCTEDGTYPSNECTEENGKYYYDPNNKEATCQDGSKIILCPALIQLSFFGLWNFIIAILMISAIYAILILKNSRRIKFL